MADKIRVMLIKLYELQLSDKPEDKLAAFQLKCEIFNALDLLRIELL